MKKALSLLLASLTILTVTATGVAGCSEIEHTHSLVFHEQQQATCVSEGNNSYWECSECGKYFSDGKGRKEMSASSVKQDLAAHDYVDGKCTVCEKEQPISTDLDFSLNTDGNSYYIKGIGKCKEKELIIPSEYKEKPVTGIGDGAFADCKQLTKVKMSNSITSIGKSAFSNCTNLVGIEISDAVTSIGSYAFSNCGKLKRVKLPEQMKEVELCTFFNCRSLVEVTIPDAVTYIQWQAFEGCDGLVKVTLGKGVKLIGDSAFSGCTKLLEVCNLSALEITADTNEFGRVAKNAKNIYTAESGQGKVSDKDGFFVYKDTDKKSIIMAYAGTDSSVEFKGDADGTEYSCYDFAFSGCEFTQVTLSDAVKSISKGAFQACRNLQSIHTGNGVTEIGDYSFYNCTSLKNIEMGSKVESIGFHAFYNCGSIESITMSADNVKYAASGNCLIEKGTSTLIFGCGYSVIPNDGSVTAIGKDAFENNFVLTEISIPNTVTQIGEGAFYNCTALVKVTIADSVSSICRRAFYNCTSLKQVGLGKGIVTIEEGAFLKCSLLTQINYNGTETDWSKIHIDENNTPLTSAERIYKS